MQKAIFIDKDGTLIENVDYNINTERITLLPGAIQTLREFKSEGYLLIVITNQSGVAKGLFGESSLRDVSHYLKKLLGLWKIQLDGFYYCPHLADGTIREYAVECACRKPKPGLLLQAAIDHNIDLKNSWMIGDLGTDVEAGKLAGCKTILYNRKDDFLYMGNPMMMPDAIASHWDQIDDIILRKEEEAYVQLI